MADSRAREILEKAKQESETLLRESRLAASQEALKTREQFEQAEVARRSEQLELERRLAERESLINSQLQRIVESEQTLSQQKDTLDPRNSARETRSCLSSRTGPGRSWNGSRI